MNALPTTADNAGDLLSGWFEAYHGPLFRYLVRLIGHPDTAADLLQDTFLRAVIALDPARPPAQPAAWLYRIATNLAYNTLRRQRRWQWLALPPHLHDARFEQGVLEAQAIRACLARLSPREAEALLLHAYAGLTSVEIATLSGEKPSTVRTRIARACARFSSLYAKEHPHDL